MDSEEDDEDFMDEDDDEKPDITPVENDSKIREIIDKICDLEDQQETVQKIMISQFFCLINSFCYFFM